jgi:hypothetical protein
MVQLRRERESKKAGKGLGKQGKPVKEVFALL